MKHSFEQYKDLMKIVGQARDLTNPYPALYEAIKNATERSRTINMVNNQAINGADYLREINQAINGAGYLREINQASAAAEIMKHYLTEWQKLLQQIQSSQIRMVDIVSPHPNKLLESINQQVATLQKLRQTDQASAKLMQSIKSQTLLEATVAWNSSLTQSLSQFQKVSLLTTQPSLAVRLLEPTRVYTKFFESTIQLLSQCENLKTAKALEVSLHLAEVQLLTTTNALSSVITTPTDDEELSATRRLHLPTIQQNELIVAARDTDIEDEEALIQLSPAASVADKSRRVLSLVAQCNEVVKVAEKPEIFKPTTKLLEVFADLPWLLPEDKKTFADFIDCLYFMFYEGAGKDKLRFLNEHGGVLDTTDCDLIWCIKHLRNKWLRHDADHGKEADIKKSWKELSAKFCWLGLEHSPINPEHFRYLHRRLINEAEAFLQKILEKLTIND